MRIALVSPYSWTYPGGVNGHIASLTKQLLARGDDVRVFAPVDPQDKITTFSHFGSTSMAVELPEWLTPLGRTIGIPSNGAVSNLAVAPASIAILRSKLREFEPDVIHLHEPVAPLASWDTLCSTNVPLVGTFHCYSTNMLPNWIAANPLGCKRRLNRLAVRIAVSEAAAWTGKRYYGGHYRVIPNGVDLSESKQVLAKDNSRADFHILFVGQAVERKGLPVLLRAFAALREHVQTTLTVIGPTFEEVAALGIELDGVSVLGRVDNATKEAQLRSADILCAPSLGGESFGMVLTEAFAAGTTVVASDIAGYRDVVRDGVDGMLVPRGDATALARELRWLALNPQRVKELSASARERAQRYSWAHVAGEVRAAYEDASSVALATKAAEPSLIRQLGFRPADPHERSQPPQKIPTLEPLGFQVKKRSRLLRRGGMLVAGGAMIWLMVKALEKIGVDNITASLLKSSPTLVLLGLVLMVSSMVFRAGAWHAMLQGALTDTKVRRRDVFRGTAIGVLMSATLPARLGEPSRALVVAKRLGKMRTFFPVVVGTIVGQTLLNLFALLLLGAATFSTLDLFTQKSGLILTIVGPVVVVLSLSVAPIVLRSASRKRGAGQQHPLRQKAANALHQIRSGIRTLANPRVACVSTVLQLAAWALQLVSCYVLVHAVGIHTHADFLAAAAVLFAVNVTAALPATPSNLGVFQLACVTVLAAYGVGHADAVAYGIVLQAVELVTAVILGTPALLGEGLSWREVRASALHASPVKLEPIRTSSDV